MLVTSGTLFLGCSGNSGNVSDFSLQSITEHKIICDGGWDNTLMELSRYDHCENFNN